MYGCEHVCVPILAVFWASVSAAEPMQLFVCLHELRCFMRVHVLCLYISVLTYIQNVDESDGFFFSQLGRKMGLENLVLEFRGYEGPIYKTHARYMLKCGCSWFGPRQHMPSTFQEDKGDGLRSFGMELRTVLGNIKEAKVHLTSFAVSLNSIRGKLNCGFNNTVYFSN